MSGSRPSNPSSATPWRAWQGSCLGERAWVVVDRAPRTDGSCSRGLAKRQRPFVRLLRTLHTLHAPLTATGLRPVSVKAAVVVGGGVVGERRVGQDQPVSPDCLRKTTTPPFIERPNPALRPRLPPRPPPSHRDRPKAGQTAWSHKGSGRSPAPGTCSRADSVRSPRPANRQRPFTEPREPTSVRSPSPANQQRPFAQMQRTATFRGEAGFGPRGRFGTSPGLGRLRRRSRASLPIEEGWSSESSGGFGGGGAKPSPDDAANRARIGQFVRRRPRDPQGGSSLSVSGLGWWVGGRERTRVVRGVR